MSPVKLNLGKSSGIIRCPLQGGGSVVVNPLSIVVSGPCFGVAPLRKLHTCAIKIVTVKTGHLV